MNIQHVFYLALFMQHVSTLVNTEYTKRAPIYAVYSYQLIVHAIFSDVIPDRIKLIWSQSTPLNVYQYSAHSGLVNINVN